MGLQCIVLAFSSSAPSFNRKKKKKKAIQVKYRINYQNMSPAHRGLGELPGLEKSSDLGMQYSLWARLSAQEGAEAWHFLGPRHTVEQCEVSGREDANY